MSSSSPKQEARSPKAVLRRQRPVLNLGQKGGASDSPSTPLKATRGDDGNNVFTYMKHNGLLTPVNDAWLEQQNGPGLEKARQNFLESRLTIVIIGACLPGLLLAKKLAKLQRFIVILIDEKERFELRDALLSVGFEPRLDEVRGLIDDYSFDLLTLFCLPRCYFVKDRVVKVTSEKVVMTRATLSYSTLIIASGSTPLASPFPTTLTLPTNPQGQLDDFKRAKSVTIVGNDGYCIRLAAELASRLSPSVSCSVYCEGNPIAGLKKQGVDSLIETLAKLGVSFKIVDSVVEKGKALLVDGETVSFTKVVWAKRKAATEYLSDKFLPFVDSASGRVSVNEAFQITANIFACGSAASVRSTADGVEYHGGDAVVNMAAVKVICQNIRDFHKNRPLQMSFKPKWLLAKRSFALTPFDAVSIDAGLIVEKGEEGRKTLQKLWDVAVAKAEKPLPDKTDKRPALNPPPNGYKIVVFVLGANARAFALKLLENRVPIRVAVIDAVMKAQFKKYPPELCEIVMMDVDEPVTIGKAFKGVDICHFSPDNSMDILRNIQPKIISVMVKATLRCVIFGWNGGLGLDVVQVQNPFFLEYRKLLQDAEILIRSGNYATICTQTNITLEAIAYFFMDGIKRKRTARCVDIPVNFVSIQDLVALWVEVTLNFNKYAGRTLIVTSSRLYRWAEYVDIVSSQLGVQVSFSPLDINEAAAFFRSMSFSNDFSQVLTTLWSTPPIFEVITTDFEEVMGRPPMSLVECLKHHLHLFQ